MKFGGITQVNDWHSYEHLKPGNVVNPDDDVTASINNIINNINIIKDEIRDMGGDLNDRIDTIVELDSRDVVFKIAAPLELGIEEDSEFIYPFDGTIYKINLGVHTKSNFISNTRISLQRLREGFNQTWTPVHVASIQFNQFRYEATDLEFEVKKNDRFRIVFLEGNFDDWLGINMIVSIKNN